MEDIALTIPDKPFPVVPSIDEGYTASTSSLNASASSTLRENVTTSQEAVTGAVTELDDTVRVSSQFLDLMHFFSDLITNRHVLPFPVRRIMLDMHGASTVRPFRVP